MTSNTTCYATYGCVDRNCDGYNFIRNKEHAYIIFNKVEKKWYLEKYDEETKKSKLIEIKDTSWIETCISEKDTV